MRSMTFIGAVNDGEAPVCGETAKNQMFLEHFRDTFDDVVLLDTLRWKRSPFLLSRLLFHLLFFRNRILVLSASPDSVDLLSRLLFRSYLKRHLYYFVIGGNFADRMASGRYDPRHYHQYKKIFVQGKRMVEILNGLGLNNVEHLSNCRKFDKSLLVGKGKLRTASDALRMVFLSRITEDKGVSVLLDAVDRLNERGLAESLRLTFYGPIADAFEDTFRERIAGLPNVRYEGFLDLRSNTGYKELSEYDLMVFPTFWHGEGFPGVVVDAFIAGLPVLATEWNLNSEVIEEGKTGFLVRPRDVEQLADKIEYARNNRAELARMSINCSAAAGDYHADKVLGRLLL